MKMEEYEEILDNISQIPVIDTHEHLVIRKICSRRNDVLQEFLIHYMSSDLISSGLDRSSGRQLECLREISSTDGS